MSKKKNIVIVGIGYVGLSNAILLARNNNVIAFDIDNEKVSMVNQGLSPLSEKEISEYLVKKEYSFRCVNESDEAFSNADYIFIATPTDYDPESNYFDTNTVESVIEDVLRVNDKAPIIIRSTIPIGFVEKIREKYNFENIIFCPEFLREGHSIQDSFYPSRIIIGAKGFDAGKVGQILASACHKEDVQVLYTEPKEAEAIKLFANSYLAMRVSFFNELDTYSISEGLCSRDIIDGVSLDPRIGDHYNNPSFGYGGYCLPKDTKQLLANYQNIPNKIIRAIVESNSIRKKYLADTIIQKQPKIVGIYRINMKSGSDNFRSSAVLDIINILMKNEIKIIIYEPDITEDLYIGCHVEKNLKKFKNNSQLIIANRVDSDISDQNNKIFTRDIFGDDE